MAIRVWRSVCIVSGMTILGAECRVLLFDVDGTLIDSNDMHAQAWTESLRQHGIAVDFLQVRPLIGMGGDKLLPAIADIAEDSERGRAIGSRKKEIFAALLGSIQPTSGARDLLAFLSRHDVTLTVATSAGKDELQALLTQARLQDLIPRQATKDDADESKPDPDIVHAALGKSGAAPEEAVMVGDTPYDIEAATRAGVRTIALRCGGYWPDEALKGAVAIYDHPQDLLAHLR